MFTTTLSFPCASINVAVPRIISTTAKSIPINGSWPKLLSRWLFGSTTPFWTEISYGTLNFSQHHSSIFESPSFPFPIFLNAAVKILPSKFSPPLYIFTTSGVPTKTISTMAAMTPAAILTMTSNAVRLISPGRLMPPTSTIAEFNSFIGGSSRS